MDGAGERLLIYTVFLLLLIGGMDNKSHCIEPNLLDLDRDMKEEVGINFE